MPCYDPDSRPDAVRAEVLKEIRHNSDVAELLCEACRMLADDNRMRLMSPALQVWWKEHQERDALRKQVQEATGARLDYFGIKANVYRWHNEPDDHFRDRVLEGYK